MKILITSEWYTPTINGVVTSVINLEKELQKLGHEVRILTLSDHKSSQKDNVTYIRSIGAGKIYPGARVSLTVDNKYIEELIEWQPDVIHSQCEFSTFRMARYIAKQLGIPIVHTYHTVYEDYTHYFSPNKKWGKAIVALFSKKILKRTACVVAPTAKVRSLLMDYGVTKSIEVVPTGIELDRFTTAVSENEKQKLRNKLDISPSQKVLIFVGRLAKEKNLEEIITFISRLNNDNLKLVIVGDGPHRKALESYAENSKMAKNIRFAGMVSPKEIASYYQLGDVFVSASTSETQGLTYVEALANGLPAICRKDPCLENVIIDGENGWQYTYYEQFCEKLEILLNQEKVYDQLSHNARNEAVRKFSSHAFAKSIERIYLKSIYPNKNKDNISVLSKAD